MKLKKKIIRKHVVIISFIFLITILLLNNPYIYSKSNSIDSDETNLKNLKKSNSWELTYIHIRLNWSYTVGNYSSCSGNGSWSNPYVIENVTIDASSSPTGSGILIENSKDVYFIIRNVTVYNAGSEYYHAGIKLIATKNGNLTNNNCSNNGYYGILLYGNCENNTISGNTANDNREDGIVIANGENNTISNNNVSNNGDRGIYLRNECQNNTISGNTAINNWEGICLEISNNNTVSRNNVSNNNRYGIRIRDSNNNTLSGNNITYCGINIEGSSLEEFSSHNIDTTNLVNDKPFYYYVNERGLGTDNFKYAGDPGQVILAYCNNSKVSNFNLSYTSIGILLYSSNNNTISGNNVNNNSIHGIFLKANCQNNTISGNNVNNNWDNGIFLWENCYNNTISGNNASNNDGGICIYSSHNNTILGNNVSNNDGGIYISSASHNNTILGNNASNNDFRGIHLDISDNNIISGNTANNNREDGIVIAYGENNTISNNNANNNDKNGITIQESNNNKFSGNNMTQCGMSFESMEDEGYSLEEIHLNSIDITNLVNEKPVYYYIHEIGLGTDNFTYAGDPGQVILVNCTKSRVSNLNFIDTSIGIILSYSNNNTISGNNASNNNRYGIRLYRSNNNNISGNPMNNNGVFGISLRDSDHNTISSNDANNNDPNNQNVGIFLDESNNNTISGNNATYNTYGIFLNDNSNNNTISGNSVSSNIKGIIFWYSCYNNNISGNILSNNDVCGIDVNDSVNEDNLFFNNYFTDNAINAIDNGNNNQWDNGVIGNYWDDYTGYDLDGDGIGDTPYNISGLAESVDRFPQIHPASPQIIIENPNTNELFGFTPPEINLTIISLNIDTIWYSLSNETFTTNNYNFTGEIEQNIWDSMGNGTVDIKVYVNNSYGLIGNSEVRVRKDIISPQIIINNPNENKEFSFNAPFYNITVVEPNLESIWYTIDNGITNITITELTANISQSAWISAPNGNVTINFYARDKAGNIGENYIIIIKDAPPEQKPKISGYHIFLLIGASSVVMVLLAKKKYIK